ncbi:hypothetical protein ES703_57890 [subsurface metagenome]
MTFLNQIRKKAKKKIIYTEHAVDEMLAEEEMISKDEVRHVIFNGEIIEEYPHDKRGHSCLIFAKTAKMRPMHVVCSPKEDYLGIITVYVPTEDKWENNFKTRKEAEIS